MSQSNQVSFSSYDATHWVCAAQHSSTQTQSWNGDPCQHPTQGSQHASPHPPLQHHTNPSWVFSLHPDSWATIGPRTYRTSKATGKGIMVYRYMPSTYETLQHLLYVLKVYKEESLIFTFDTFRISSLVVKMYKR